jgi:endonuclease-3
MTRAEKAQRVRGILAKLYPLPPIPLRHEDPYTLLLAVVLSAQCTDARVNQVTPNLFARAATPEAMARLDARDIEAIIKPCGLAPAKARNIRELSRLLVERHGGAVPQDFAALEALPGVGHKTASVVMAQAFAQPAFPVDTHIHRLAARWGLSSGTNVAATERDLKKLFPPSEWAALHLEMIYFGREHCPARAHDLAGCPICSWAATKRRAVRERARGRTDAAVPGHRRRRGVTGQRADGIPATKTERSVARRPAAAGHAPTSTPSRARHRDVDRERAAAGTPSGRARAR